jgi:hypothetical protein
VASDTRHGRSPVAVDERGGRRGDRSRIRSGG